MHYFNSPSIWLIGKICIVWTIRDKETNYSKGVRRFPPPPLLADVSQSLVRRPNKFTIPRKLLEIIRRINPKAIPLSLEDLYTWFICVTAFQLIGGEERFRWLQIVFADHKKRELSNELKSEQRIDWKIKEM